MALLDEIRAKVPQALLDARNLDEIARLVSAGRTRTRLVPIDDIQARMQSSGAWWSIKAIAEAPQHPVAMAAVAVIDLARSRLKNVDTSLDLVRNTFAALVAAGALPQADADAIAAMAIEPAPVDRLDVEAVLYEPDGTPKWL